MPVVSLTLDSSQAVSGLSKYDKAVDKSAKNTDSAFSKMRDSVNKHSAKIKTASLAVGAAVLAIGVKSLQAASRMEDMQGKFDVVFRGLNAQAEGWSKTLTESFGLSELASKTYLSSIQDLLVPTGMARDAAGEMSNEFVKLAVDLSAFNGNKVSDVILDIQSALAGSSETLTKYGIDVKVAALQQEAMRLGLITSRKEMTRQTSTVALLSIMQRESSDAMGQFARESGTFAGQQKILQATLEDISITIGKRLLPMATDYISQLNIWVKSSDAINNAALITVKVLHFLHDGINALIALPTLVITAFTTLFDLLVTGFVKVMVPVGLLADGLVALGQLKANPFEQLQKSVAGFNQHMQAALKTEIDGALDTSHAYRKKEEELQAVIDATARQKVAAEQAAAVTSEVAVPAEEKLKNIIDRVSESTKASTTALVDQAAAARAVGTALSWANKADQEYASGGVGVSLGGEEARFNESTGRWETQQQARGGGGTTVINNNNLNLGKAQIANLNQMQAREGAQI